MVSELQTDLLTGRQTLIAEGRSGRPQQTHAATLQIDSASDPFLEGHESETPHERLALRQTDSDSDGPGWLVRVVPNRYPAVAARQPSDESAFGKASGVHDVVIECPDARTSLTEFSATEVARILSAWQLRLRVLTNETALQQISIFRNEGARAGASMPHAHSQILATSFLPQAAATRLQRERESHEQHDASLFDRWQQQERADGRRIVADDTDVMVVCPLAPRVAWQTRLCPPTGPSLPFAELPETTIIQLAIRLKQIIDVLAVTIGSFSVNLLLHLPPSSTALKVRDAEDISWPWMLDIVPRTAGIAGYELMAEVDIVTLSSETAAARLRDHIRSSAASVAFNDVDPALESTEASDQEDSRLCPAGFEWRHAETQS